MTTDDTAGRLAAARDRLKLAMLDLAPSEPLGLDDDDARDYRFSVARKIDAALKYEKAMVTEACRQGRIEALREVMPMVLEAVRLTREYVGEALLPNLPGWSHFDAVQRLNALLAEAEGRNAR